jgi:hypothetical protein
LPTISFSRSFNLNNTNLARSSNPTKAPRIPSASSLNCSPTRGALPFGAMPLLLDLVCQVASELYRETAARW